MLNSRMKKTAIALGLALSGSVWADYVIIDLGTLGGAYSSAMSINNNGDVVGTSTLANGTQHAFLFTSADGVMTDIDQRSGMSSYAMAINNAGEIVGLENPTYSVPTQPFKYSNGVMTTLPIVEYDGMQNSAAYGINDAGKVVGTTQMSDGWMAYSYVPGTQTDLGRITSSRFNSTAFGINSAGKTVGMAYHPVTHTMDAVLFENGITVLGMGTDDGRSAIAYDINDKNEIVGGYYSGGSLYPFFYKNNVITPLDLNGGGYAYAINENSVVVGQTIITNTYRRAFIWSGGFREDLNSYLPPDSGWTLTTARDINDDGWIVGEGTINGQTHAYLMAPGC